MIGPKEIAQLDQWIQAMRDLYVPLTMTLFNGFIEGGLTRIEALQTAMFIVGNFQNGGIRRKFKRRKER